MNVFRNMDKVATANTNATLSTLHQNRISAIQQHTGSKGAPVTKFSTTGIDGLLAVWDVRVRFENFEGFMLSKTRPHLTSVKCGDSRSISRLCL